MTKIDYIPEDQRKAVADWFTSHDIDPLDVRERGLDVERLDDGNYRTSWDRFLRDAEGYKRVERQVDGYTFMTERQEIVTDTAPPIEQERP